MRASRRVWALVGILALAGIGLAAMATPREPARGGARSRIAFQDDFSGSRLNHRHWSPCYWWAKGGCTIATNHELEWYLPNQVQVRNGIASLVAAHRAVRGTAGRSYRFASGMISSGPPPGSSSPKFAFRYGRVEARVRVPAGAGLWSAFWLLPANRSDLPEIDAMEILGQSPGNVLMHLHYLGRGGRELSEGAHFRRRSLAYGWHKFGIDWRPGRIAWLVDGVVRWRVTGSAVPHTRMYLIANLAVGGGPAGTPAADTRFPSALRIDWVRVWQ